MGVWSTVVDALGLRRPPVVQEPGPLSLTRGGKARLDRLPPSVEVVVSAVPTEGGWLAAVRESQVPDSGFQRTVDGFWIRPEDAARLLGLKLDHDGSVWKVQLELTVQAGETPNPNGRMYRLDRSVHRGRPGWWTRTRGRPPALIRTLFEHKDIVSVLLRDHTLTVERSAAAPWSGIDRHVDAAIRAHFLLGGAPVDGDTGPLGDGTLHDQVQRVLEAEVLPGVHRDGGDIEIVLIEHGVVHVRLRGACASCPASVLTLKGAVERTLKGAFPEEIREVRAI